MKNRKSRLLAAIVLSGMILTTFGGCSDDENSSASSSVPSANGSLSDEEIAAVQQPGLKFTYGEPASSSNELDNPDPTSPAVTSAVSSSPASQNAVTSVAVVTDAQGSAVTKIANVTNSAGSVVTTHEVVTDSAGTPVTEAGGQTVTSIVNVTEVVQETQVVTVSQAAAETGNADNTSNNNNTNASGNSGNETETTTSSGSNYQANMKTFNAMWLDVSESTNYTFNDTFIEVKVKINEDIPDGKYPINITWPDFAAYDLAVVGKSVDPDSDHVINGAVYVNTPVEEQNIPSDGGFTVIAQNVEGKQGEEVTLKFDIQNNPGICAVNFNFEYDENAVTILGAHAVGDFQEISKGKLS